MKKIKRILTLLLSITLIFSTTTTIYAKDDNEPLKHSFIGNGNYIEVTDKTLIYQIAKEQNLDNPEKINKISINYINTNFANSLPNNNPDINMVKGTITTHLSNVEDLGDRFAYWDQYTSYWYDGYLENTKTFEMSASATCSTEVSIPVSIVNTKFGINIGVSAKYTEQTKIIVPANQRVNVKTVVNYQKKTFDIFYEYSTSPGLWYPKGTGTVFIPVGLIITQTYYDK